MLHFFKVLLRGIICTLLLPFIILLWVLYAVYCLITFIVMFIKSVVLFFMGDSINDELPEDIESKRILLEAEKAQANNQEMINMMYQNMAQMNQGFPQQNPFYQPQGQYPQQQNSFEQPQSNIQQPNQNFGHVEPQSTNNENEINSEGGNNDDESY